jgi:hypothetical protein
MQHVDPPSTIVPTRLTLKLGGVGSALREDAVGTDTSIVARAAMITAERRIAQRLFSLT